MPPPPMSRIGLSLSPVLCCEAAREAARHGRSGESDLEHALRAGRTSGSGGGPYMASSRSFLALFCGQRATHVTSAQRAWMQMPWAALLSTHVGLRRDLLDRLGVGRKRGSEGSGSERRGEVSECDAAAHDGARGRHQSSVDGEEGKHR